MQRRLWILLAAMAIAIPTLSYALKPVFLNVIAEASDAEEIRKVTIDGDVYYYARAGCCDQFNDLYNDYGLLVCSPDGGFTGAGNKQEKCPNLPEFDRHGGEVVWQKTRATAPATARKPINQQPVTPLPLPQQQ